MSKITEDIVKKYKGNTKLESYYYDFKDKNGHIVSLDKVVNPLELDLRQMMSPTDNQYEVPSCTAFSICTIAESLIWQKTGKLVNLNSDMVYAKAKELDKNTCDGTSLENSIKAAFMLGGFGVDNIKINVHYNDKTAKTIEMIKFMIHKHLFVQFGFAIKSNWYECDNKNYYINHSGKDLGGHAVASGGYLKDGLIILNSWGTEWGSKGYGILRWKDVLDSLVYFCTIDGLFKDL